MSKLARDHRNRDLGQIHALQKKLNILGDDAEALKLTVTGVASSALMSYEQRAKYLAHLRQLAAPKGLVKTHMKLFGPIAKAFSLWQEIADAGGIKNRTYRALEVYSEHLTGVTKLDWLTGPQQNLLVESLKKWKARL